MPYEEQPQQAAEQPQHEPEQQPEQPQEQQHEQQQQESPADRNFRELREQNEAYKKRLEELERKVQSPQQKQEKKKEPEPSVDEDDISDHDLVEGRHVKKKINNIKREWDAWKQQMSSEQAEMKLRQNYTDFNTVLTTQNVQDLREKYPTWAKAIANASDPYTQGEMAYSMVKKLIHEPQQQQHEQDKEKERVNENAQAPRPAQPKRTQDSPLNYAHEYAQSEQEKRDQIYRQLCENAKKMG